MDRPLSIKTGVVLAVCGTIIGTMLWFGVTTAFDRIADHERRITRMEASYDALVGKIDKIDEKTDRIDGKLDRMIERGLKEAK